MKLIIDISKKDLKEFNAEIVSFATFDRIIKKINNGIPLDDFLKRRKEPIDKSVVESYLKENKQRYDIALSVACDLLNGATLYGYDVDRIYSEIMDKEGVVTGKSYRKFIFDHLEELGCEYFAEENKQWIL